MRGDHRFAGCRDAQSLAAMGFMIAAGAAVFPGNPATFAPTVHWQALGS